MVFNLKGTYNMGGLAIICKMYGTITVTGSDGRKVIWVWDYANEVPRIKSDMTKEEIAASEKAKYTKNFIP